MCMIFDEYGNLPPHAIKARLYFSERLRSEGFEQFAEVLYPYPTSPDRFEPVNPIPQRKNAHSREIPNRRSGRRSEGPMEFLAGWVGSPRQERQTVPRGITSGYHDD